MLTHITHAELTAEELAELQAFANANGRTWRSALRSAWMAGSEQLRSVRNKLGPSGLDRIRITIAKPEAMTAAGRLRGDVPRNLTRNERILCKQLRHASEHLDPGSVFLAEPEMRRVLLSFANFIEFGNAYLPQLAGNVTRLAETFTDVKGTN